MVLLILEVHCWVVALFHLALAELTEMTVSV